MTMLATPPSLERPDLLVRLAGASRAHPLTLILAPSGYGKSQLLRDFARAEGGFLVDLSATARFGFYAAVRAVCDAVTPRAPGARLAFSSAYERHQQRGRLADLGAWLAHHLRGARLLLALDGVDTLAGDVVTFAAFLERLVEGGSDVRVVVGAQPDTDLPLPRWLSSGITGMPLGPDDLLWSPNDVCAYRETCNSSDYAVPERPMRVFDIVFRELTGAFPPPNAHTADLLFAALREDERSFILETCLFPCLTDEVLGAAGLTHGLSALGRLAPLLVRETSVGPAYNAPVAERARTMLRADDMLFRIVAERSVRALELAGAVREAIDTAFECELIDELARLLELHGLQLNDWGQVETVDKALALISPESETPTVLLLRGLHDARRGRLDTSEAWFRHAIDRAHDTRTRAEAACRLARELLRRQRTDGADLILPFADDPDVTVAQRAAILAILAETHHIAGRHESARSTMASAMALAEYLDVGQRAELFTRAAYVEYFLGDSKASAEYARIAAKSANLAGRYVFAYSAYTVLYNIAYNAGDASACLSYIREMGEAAIRSGNHEFHLSAVVAELGIHSQRGDVEALERLEMSLSGFDLNYAEPTVVQALLPARALAMAWNGRFGTAFELLAPSAEQQLPGDQSVRRWAESALYAAAAGKLDAARAALAHIKDADPNTPFGASSLIIGRLAASFGISVEIDRVVQPPSEALSVMQDAVDAVIAARKRKPASLLEKFEALYAYDLGGYAKLFAALPGT